MSDTYDSMRSGGYRDISLLLKIDTQGVLALSLEFMLTRTLILTCSLGHRNKNFGNRGTYRRTAALPRSDRGKEKL